MNDSNNKISIFNAKQDTRVREHDAYSLRLPKQQADGDEEVLHVSDDVLAEAKITPRKSINWNYVALAILTLGAFFLMIKALSEPVEPIIIMEEPAIVHLATAPENSEGTEAQSLSLSSSESTSNHMLLPNESIETLPPVASLPAEELATKGAINTDIPVEDASTQKLAEIELAKKTAKQKAKKKAEEAMQQSPIPTNPPVESQPQQSIVVLQKEPVVATDAKKDTVKEATKEAVKSPPKEKSPWSTFADSIKQGGEAPCSPAQIAMHQCS